MTYDAQAFEEAHGADPVQLLADKIHRIGHVYGDATAKAVVIVANNEPHFVVLPAEMVRKVVSEMRRHQGKPKAVAFSAYVSSFRSDNGKPYFGSIEFYGV